MELQVIQSKIYQIRGLRVILDKDLAELYEVTTSNLNKAVKRNLDRFPSDFMFQLNNEEFDLIFQNGTSSWGGTRKLPYAFTELNITKRTLQRPLPTARGKTGRNPQAERRQAQVGHPNGNGQDNPAGNLTGAHPDLRTKILRPQLRFPHQPQCPSSAEKRQ